MWVIVKHVVIIENNESINMMAIQVAEGYRYSLKDAMRIADRLNDKLDDKVYDCVHILDHS